MLTLTLHLVNTFGVTSSFNSRELSTYTAMDILTQVLILNQNINTLRGATSSSSYIPASTIGQIYFKYMA